MKRKILLGLKDWKNLLKCITDNTRKNTTKFGTLKIRKKFQILLKSVPEYMTRNNGIEVKG